MRIVIIIIACLTFTNAFSQSDSIALIKRINDCIQSSNYKGPLNITVKSIDQQGGQTAFIINNTFQEKTFSQPYKEWLLRELISVQKKEHIDSISIGGWMNIVSPVALDDLEDYLRKSGLKYIKINRPIYVDVTGSPHVGVDAVLEKKCIDIRVGSIPKE